MRAGVRGTSPAPRLSSPGLVGRARELEAAREALAEPPALVLVEGEAGVGKSRLVHELLDRAGTAPTRRGRRPLIAVCPPLDQPFTLGPIVDAVRQACDGVAGLPLTALAGALRPLFPEWADDLPAAPEPLDDPTAARHRSFRAMAELIGALEVGVLVLEDVHWADEATLDFLLFLTAHQPRTDLAVVLTYRPEEVPSGSPLLRLSSRSPAGVRHRRLTLTPLDASDTARMVSSMLDATAVSERLAIEVHRHTDGLPLAIEETVRLLHDRADLVRINGEWTRRTTDDLDVTATLRDSVLERVQRLGGTAQRLLEAAAVLTEPAAPPLLRALAGLDDPAASSALAEVMDSGLIVEDSDTGRLRLRHVLTATAIYRSLPPSSRRTLHRRAAHLLERTDPPPLPQLARHYRRADDLAKWSGFAEKAADLALASGDNTAALTLLVDVLPHEQLPASVRARLARKLTHAALARDSASLDLVRRIADTVRATLGSTSISTLEKARIRNPLGRLLIQIGDFEAARVELAAAVRGLRSEPVEAARVMTYLGWPRGTDWQASRHLTWLRRAAEITPPAVSRSDRVALAVNRSTALLLLGQESGWSVAADVPEEATTKDEARLVATGQLNTGHAALLWGHYADAARRLAIAERLARSVRNERLGRNAAITRAHLDWFTGAWDGLAGRLHTLVEDDEVEMEPRLEAEILLGLLAAATGDLDAAEQRLRPAMEDVWRRGIVDYVMDPAAALARIRLHRGEVSEALALTDEAISALAHKGVWLWGTAIVPVRVEALIADDRGTEASTLVETFSRGLRGRSAPAARAALTTSRAILARGRGDAARAAQLFSRAATAWQRLPRPYDALLAREQAAHSLAADDPGPHPRALLAETVEGLRRLGARYDADRITEHQGAGRPPTHRRGPGRRGYGPRLSPREIEVVRLVTAGHTNREIAGILNRSPKTVATQVASAMRKLGVSSRTALAVSALDSGILSRPVVGAR